jgi:thiosulfate/3-mercaptopyruvate sulfurtransferase
MRRTAAELAERSPPQRARTAARAPLISAEELVARLGEPGLVIVEVDEQPLLYWMRHIPGAQMLDWHADLQDPVTRDVPSPEAMKRLWSRFGVEDGGTVVLYGDKYNLYACYAYWVFWLYGLRNMLILDGGRPLWLSRRLPTEAAEPATPPVAAPNPRLDGECRAAWWHLVTDPPAALIDVRTPEEYTGELLAEPGYPAEVAQRPGHIPGARNVPWTEATELDGRFKPVGELRELYRRAGVHPDAATVSYCRIGERSAHTWFVLHQLLGHRDVRNYDGSWTEWGSMAGMPVGIGAEPGSLPDELPMTRGLLPLGLRRDPA